MKADRAYANIEVLKGGNTAAGAGVTIGFVDSGIDLDHAVFFEQTATEQFLSGATDETGTIFSHGTGVASIAAAGKITSPTAAWGVAWGADIAMFAIPLDLAGGVYNPISLAGLDGEDDDWAADFNTVLGWRDGTRKVDILNLSIGYKGIIDNYTTQELRQNFDAAIAAMAQAGASEKVIMVWSAGNAQGRTCSSPTPNCINDKINAVSVQVLPGLAARISELRGHTIAVAALRQSDGAIASFSNRCGIAAGYCIAAPGEGMTAAYFGPDPVTSDPGVRGYDIAGRGTSYSAPMVAGGLALMKQLFRDQLSNTELVTRLFATANKSGVYAVSAIYGQGAMDLAAATSPVGVLEVPGTNTAPNGVRLSSTHLRPGAALGDGLRRSLATRQIMVLDALGAPFWYSLGSFTASAGGLPVAARLRGFLAGEPGWPSGVSAGSGGEAGTGDGVAPVRLYAARLNSQAEIRGSHLALAEGAVKATLAGQDGLSAAAFTTKGVPGRQPTLGAALNWRRAGSPLGLRAGWIGEPETLLGSIGEGAFGTLAGDTAFLGLDAGADLGVWRIGATAELGIVAPEIRGGLITRVSPLATSAFALHVARGLGSTGALRLSVAQPLRVEIGRASLTVPAGRTKAGVVMYGAVPADLAPSGRQLDIAGEWRRPLAKGELRLGTVLSLRPGHRKAAAPEMTFLGGWRWEF